jgi:alpha-galactosidase/6-phospho-beta-glucosidase family protein
MQTLSRGDRDTAPQCMLLDPLITDLDIARQVLDAYLQAYRPHLPRFWQWSPYVP